MIKLIKPRNSCETLLTLWISVARTWCAWWGGSRQANDMPAMKHPHLSVLKQMSRNDLHNEWVFKKKSHKSAEVKSEKSLLFPMFVQLFLAWQMSGFAFESLCFMLLGSALFLLLLLALWNWPCSSGLQGFSGFNFSVCIMSKHNRDSAKQCNTSWNDLEAGKCVPRKCVMVA